MFKSLFSNFSKLCENLENSMNTMFQSCQYQNSINFQTGSKNKITINGKTYSGKNVSINGNKVIIDGKETNQNIDEIKEITLKIENISKTTENTITNPPIESRVLTPLNTAFPNKTKNPLSSLYLLFIVFNTFVFNEYVSLLKDSLP